MQIESISPKDLTEQFIQSTVKDEKEISSQMAMVVHSNRSGTLSCITRHRITNNKLGIGEILSVEDVAATFNNIEQANALEKNNWFNGFSDENIIAKSSELLAWHTPRESRVLYLADESVTVTLPPLFYVYRPKKGQYPASLSVFALAANKRPNANTKLYHAPLMNIYESGKLCLGTMRLPDEVNDQTITSVDKEFFGSRFVHPNHNNLTRKQMNIRAFYKMKEKSDQRIMTSELMPTGKTLNEVLG